VILDELHALVTSKRGDLLSLGLARLQTIAPGLTTIGLSATVREPDRLRRYLVGGLAVSGELDARSPPQGGGEQVEPALADLVVVQGGAEPDIRMLELDFALPLAGHTGASAMPAIYELISQHKTTLVFVNTVPGRVCVPGAVAHQRWQFADRTPPRLA
jgi:ATP-dependent Lhr-like helicase